MFCPFHTHPIHHVLREQSLRLARGSRSFFGAGGGLHLNKQTLFYKGFECDMAWFFSLHLNEKSGPKWEVVPVAQGGLLRVS